MAQYFVDTGDGIEYYKTEVEAKEAAHTAIHNWLEAADGEWSEEVRDVCWGQVREVAIEKRVQDHSGNETEYVRYELGTVE